MDNGFSNIYKLAREKIGITQEEASFLIGVSSRTISNYETFTTIPGEEVVDKMVTTYNAPWLAYVHFKVSTKLGRKYLPDVYINDLAKAVLNFQKELGDVSKIKPSLIRLACGGIEESKDEYRSEISKEIMEAIGAGFSVIYAMH